jgi:hypothetical protein
LLSTDPRYNRRSLASLQAVEGRYRPGDTFFLATDALACCLLAAMELGEQPWQRLADLSASSFDDAVTRLRRTGRLRNDDVTLLVVHTTLTGEASSALASAAPEPVAHHVPATAVSAD